MKIILTVISVDGGNFEKLPPITYSVELNPTKARETLEKRCQSNNFYFTGKYLLKMKN